MAQLVTGFTISKLIEHLKDRNMDLDKALNNTPCLVFRPITGNQSPIYNSDNIGQPISKVFRLSETDSSEDALANSPAHSYLSTQAVIAPLWKSDRNSIRGMITVGRSGTCDVRVNSPQVSKIHAIFQEDKEKGIWTITDNNSTNGTRVNNNELSGKDVYRLENNTEISLGDIHTIFLTREGLVALCALVEDMREPETIRLRREP